MICTAKHENGTTWRLAVRVNEKRGEDHARYEAANCARNYCRKNKMAGRVELTNEETGGVFFANVSVLYTLEVEVA